jgi:hypothetical protein
VSARTCAAALLLALPFQLLAAQGGESRTTLSPDSDGGGTTFTVSCGPDRALIGITGGSGQWVDRVGGVCIQVTNDGQWIGSETSTPPSTGSSGTSFTIRCGANSAVAGLSGRAGSWLDRLQVHCRALGSAGTLKDDLRLAGATGGTGGTTGFGPHACDDNKPARALTGTAASMLGAALVGRLGLVCARPNVLRLQTLSLMAFSTVSPNLSRGEVELTRVTPTTLTVALSSSNPAVASVAPTVTVSGGQSGNAFTIRPGATGCANITASNDNVSRVQPFVVQYPASPDPARFDLGSPGRLLLAPSQSTGSLRIDGGAGFTVSLASSNGSVATVPASVTVPTTAMGIGSYPITATGKGCTVITGTYGGQVLRRVVMVGEIGG